MAPQRPKPETPDGCGLSLPPSGSGPLAGLAGGDVAASRPSGHVSRDRITRNRYRVKALRMAGNALAHFAELSLLGIPMSADGAAVVASAIRVINAERDLCVAADLRERQRSAERRANAEAAG